MTISLAKGQPLDLTKNNPSLKKITLGLGWDPSLGGADCDLDASAFLLNATGKVSPDENFVFYNNLISNCKSVKHHGDNKTGGGAGDDEQITVDLTQVPAHIDKIVFVVTIHEAAQRGQSFGLVRNAFIRVFDTDTQAELGKVDLTEDSSVARAVIFGEIYRRDGEWRFKATGETVYDNGLPGDLKSLAQSYGLDIG